MIVAACVRFLLTLLKISHIGTVSLRKEVAILANLLHICFVNLLFMAMRVVVVKNNKKDDNESIFITKNLISIFLSAMQIYWIRKS